MSTCGLTWNVVIEDVTAKQIKAYNVFNHGGFMDDLKKAAKKFAKDREAFEAEVRKSLKYWYWAKCEWEVIVSTWPPSDKGPARKIDVSDQIMANWPVFIDYVWKHAVDLRRREKKVAD